MSCIPPTTTRPRRAVTLLELLLTLGLLVAVAAMVWPQLTVPMENLRLSKAADQVRADLGSARVRAMTSGEIHAFRYTLQGDQYAIERWQGPDSQLESSDAAAVADEAAPSAAAEVRQRVLPEGVTFVEAKVEQDTRSLQTQQTADASLQAAAEQALILLYPDGSTSTASVLLGNRFGRRVAVELRGVTGVARTGQVYAAEQGAGP